MNKFKSIFIVSEHKYIIREVNYFNRVYAIFYLFSRKIGMDSYFRNAREATHIFQNFGIRSN